MAKRLKNWDYSRKGAYFITICVDKMRCDFGYIRDGVPVLSLIGSQVNALWLEIPGHHGNVELGEYIVMPNHFHGLVFILEGADFDARPNQFGKPVSRSISVIVGGFKSAVTRWCNENGLGFAWQRGFHDSIIRDERHLQNVRNYIVENPAKWDGDKGDHPEFLE